MFIKKYKTMPHVLDYDLLEYAEKLGHGDIHIKLDPSTGLRAVVAIHSTRRGPALGGCRFLPYESVVDALYDAMRLARAMSYKAAIADLPLGGGKSVLLKPKKISDRKAYFQSFGRFVNELGGRYITAVDVGTSIEDMDTIATVTPYVSSTSREGDPSPYTALGVCSGIEAAVKFQLKRDSLKGVHIAIQGLGSVGYPLAKALHQRGAKLTVCDMNAAAVDRCVKEFHAQAVALDDIYTVNADVFAPCALGQVLNEHTIPKLKVKIVAGSANNQLEEEKDGVALMKRDILYAPDYLINAGGLIYAYTQYNKKPADTITQRIAHISEALTEIFTVSAREHRATATIADEMALKILKG